MQYELKFVKTKKETGATYIMIFAKKEGNDFYELFHNPILAKDISTECVQKNIYSIPDSVDRKIISRLLLLGFIREYVHDGYLFRQEFLDSMPTSREFFNMNIYKFRIGDMVEVINNGETYSVYSCWHGLSQNYSNCFVEHSLPKEGCIYKIINIDMHGSSYRANDVLVLIQDINTSQVYIIDEKGIRATNV